MTDLTRSPDSNRDSGDYPGVPRWVKVLGIIGLVLVALLVILLLFAGGEHGPGRHTGGDGGDHGANAPPIDGAPEVAVTAGDLSFRPNPIELRAGEPVNVALTSADSEHDLIVDEANFHLAADRNQTVIGGLVFSQPGTYVGYCSIPGHRDSGMELEFVVR